MAVKSGKFAGPIASGRVGISQTDHGESATKPSDLSEQDAIDILIAGNKPFYSICYGDVIKTHSAGAQSYLTVRPKGASFYVLYVHTYKWKVKAGDKVKPGQELGLVYPQKYAHLHLGLKNITGKAPHPRPMDYFDRAVKFSTPYVSIKKLWFKGSEIDWSKFKDLRYDGVTVTAPDHCADKIKAAMTTIEAKHKTETKILVENHAATIKELNSRWENEVLILSEESKIAINLRESERAKYQRLYQEAKVELSKRGINYHLTEILKHIRQSFKKKTE